MNCVAARVVNKASETFRPSVDILVMIANTRLDILVMIANTRLVIARCKNVRARFGWYEAKGTGHPYFVYRRGLCRLYGLRMHARVLVSFSTHE